MAKTAEKKPSKVQLIELTTAGAAQLLGISRQRLEQMVDEGSVRRKAPNCYVLGELVPDVVARAQNDRRTSTEKHADNRVRQARAAQIELATAIKARDYIPLTDAQAAVDALCGIVRTEAAGIAPRCTREVSLRRTIEAEVNGSLSRIAERLRQVSSALQQGRDLADTIATDDTGPVGEEQSNVSVLGGSAGSA